MATQQNPAASTEAGGEQAFKLTYATMFNPPALLHDKFEAALAKIKGEMGRDHAMLINGQDRFAEEKFADHSPINTNWLLGTFQKGSAQDVEDALQAARDAWPGWRSTPWQKRVEILRKAAGLIEERVYEIGAVMALEVGKNRMEALGDAQETADLVYYSCDSMESNDGFIKPMGSDPLVGYKSTNTSVLKPYGVWAVISPFNFPSALTGGPSGAALVAGNCVIAKPATDTPWTVRLLAECFRDAGVPDGVFNYVTGPGRTVGQALIDSPQVDGITFTGSFDVGMHIYRVFSQGRYPRPIILEMGGKNPVIVSRHANLEHAATGIVRSAFGLQGQKCSANSRIFVEEPLKEALTERLVELTSKIAVGDPTKKEIWMGPMINENAYRQFSQYTEELSEAGDILIGGKYLVEGDLANGYFCEPTIADNVPVDQRLWQHEMFMPITMIHPVKDLDEAMTLANDSTYGLTAGFYGSEEEVGWFFDNIESGVTYANRPQGSTTGAWPGYQPFGGWKGSGSSGKNAGGLYYLPLYMHEQIHTLVE